MDTKMHFLFVVLLCILQCQVFEFRALEGPATHVHQIPHHHHVRVATAVEPQRVATKTEPSTVPVTAANTDTPVKSNEPVSKSTPVTAEKTPENPTTEKSTNAKQEQSLIEEPKSTATDIETNDDLGTTPTEKPTPVYEAADEGRKPETVTPITKDYNEESSETQVAEINEDAEPTPTNSAEAKTLPKTNQEAAKEVEERPVTVSNVWHKISAGSEEEDTSTEDAVNTENRAENFKTEAVKEVACEQCKAKLESMESQAK